MESVTENLKLSLLSKSLEVGTKINRPLLFVSSAPVTVLAPAVICLSVVVPSDVTHKAPLVGKSATGNVMVLIACWSTSNPPIERVLLPLPSRGGVIQTVPFSKVPS